MTLFILHDAPKSWDPLAGEVSEETSRALAGLEMVPPCTSTIDVNSLSPAARAALSEYRDATAAEAERAAVRLKIPEMPAMNRHARRAAKAGRQ